ncbi:MAG: hypothetical protein N2Z73_03535 [Endomicrobia bacterium]|nr:hypothetical protein [Endomicrobiia bacterium]
MKNNELKFLLIATYLFLSLSSSLFSFNFLINILYSTLPQPIRSAFKAEGLQIDQFEYGFGNCNFLSFGYLTSVMNYHCGSIVNEEFKFAVPTLYLYGGYIAHVSTPMLHIIYPGWQLETEVGWGGISYSPQFKEKYRQFFVTGTSGFNWRIYKSPQQTNKSFTINLLTGYKLHYLLKDLLYYGIQFGSILHPKISLSFEWNHTYKGGNFFIFSRETIPTISSETHYLLSLNFILSKKYLLKISSVYKKWWLYEKGTPETQQKLDLYGIILSLVNK